MSSSDAPHIPVLLREVLEALSPKDGGTYVDGTFGAGGYSRAVLDAAKDSIVYAIDRDPSAIVTAENLAKTYPGRLIPVRGCFGDMDKLLADQCPDGVDGIMLDIGVSSMQIDDGARGFSFQKDGALDMRMDPEHGESAADLVNTMDEEDLANLLYKYGDERKSRRIARRIVEARAEQLIETTAALAEIIRRALPPKRGDKIDPSTRSFQALRIAVNDELGELERGLNAAAKILKPGGILAVVTFHSLEDRIVKNFFRSYAAPKTHMSRYAPAERAAEALAEANAFPFRLRQRKPETASDEEIKRNPRSRSANLRWAIRTETAWP
ncbi:MAG: 16S rRNA (cytosine(1402)-N(4))-methyltransferase RsmH [Pseudomonadota bacterium]|nr:16S rRNA (cytosine(1402)-N(4))-methyltransferase RsmH [Pseudomonadota bacterium]QKK06059.1 MAG: 16S rRNA (cytosine(1402)-N(4))-methyltransferase RsmH [Pseudomonadota bacterium]